MMALDGNERRRITPDKSPPHSVVLRPSRQFNIRGEFAIIFPRNIRDHMEELSVVQLQTIRRLIATHSMAWRRHWRHQPRGNDRSRWSATHSSCTIQHRTRIIRHTVEITFTLYRNRWACAKWQFQGNCSWSADWGPVLRRKFLDLMRPIHTWNGLNPANHALMLHKLVEVLSWLGCSHFKPWIFHFILINTHLLHCILVPVYSYSLCCSPALWSINVISSC